MNSSKGGDDRVPEDFYNLTPVSSTAPPDDGITVDHVPVQATPAPIPRSPTSPGGERLVFRPTTELYERRYRLTEHKYEVIDLDEDFHRNEKLYCFNGLLPLDYVVNVINGLVLLTALGGITFSCYRISKATHHLVGVRSLDHLLVSSNFLLLIFPTPLGFLLLLCSLTGLYFSLRAGSRHGFGPYVQVPRARRRIDVAYHSSLYLCSLLNFSYLMAAILSFVYMTRRNGVYTSSSWPILLQTHPRFHCLLEQRLHCASKCDNRVNSVRFSNCPGAFCVDFCRVNPDIPFNLSSVHPICRPCKVGGPHLRDFFSECRKLEIQLSVTNDTGFGLHDREASDGNIVPADGSESLSVDRNCIDLAGRDLLKSGMYSVIVSCVYMSCIFALNSIACYRLCYL